MAPPCLLGGNQERGTLVPRGFSGSLEGKSWERDLHSHWHVKECMIVDDNTTFSFNPIKPEVAL